MIKIFDMFENAYNIAPITILKWNTGSIPINEILEIAKKYFVIGFGNRNGKGTTHTYFITLIKRRERNDLGHNNK